MSVMVGSVVGPYRIVRLLGEGGMGAVYEAINDAIERRVAIKVLRPDYAKKPELVARFFLEARASNRIGHPSIVQVYEQGHLPDGTAYIVMEYLEGKTLSQRLKECGGQLPDQAASQIAWQVATALAAAHAKNIVHRDMNPSNLMLIPDPFGPGGERVKVLDFGIAKLLADSREGMPASQLVVGTPTYMSPEQYHGEDCVDDKTDVYSVGAILFEMLAGRPPFVSEGADALVGMHLFQAPPPLAELVPEAPPELVAFTERLLSKDKTQRPSMQEAALQLAQFASVDGTMLFSGTRVPTGAIAAVLAPSKSSAALSSVTPPVDPTLRKRSGQSSSGIRWARLLGSGLAGALGALAFLFLLRALAIRAPTHPSPITEPPIPEPVATAPTVPDAPPSTKKPYTPTPRAFRPLSVKLPPLRTASDLPIIVPQKVQQPLTASAQPEAPAAPAVDNVLSDAQREYLSRNYSKAIELAKTVQQQSPSRAWRIVGSSACGLKDLKTIKESYFKLDASGREYLFFVCKRNGMNIGPIVGAAKP